MHQHHISKNLRPEEAQLIETLLGDDRKCFSMAIAELAISPIQNISGNANEQTFEWQSVIRPGVVCFIQDFGRNNQYFIHAYDMDKGLKVYEQRLETKLKYKRRRRHILTLTSSKDSQNRCGPPLSVILTVKKLYNLQAILV